MEDVHNFYITKTDNERIEIILSNVIKMLSNRIYITKSGKKKELVKRNATFEENNDNVYILTANNKKKYALKITFQKITKIGKQSMLSNFLKDYVVYNKILIAEDFNNKIIDYAKKNNCQTFKVASMMRDILSYHEQPQFEILSKQEIALLQQEYSIDPYTIQKLKDYDPITKYFDLSKGDVVRIIRPSQTSGYAIGYRIVE